jgi:hypothetical protein
MQRPALILGVPMRDLEKLPGDTPLTPEEAEALLKANPIALSPTWTSIDIALNRVKVAFDRLFTPESGSIKDPKLIAEYDDACWQLHVELDHAGIKSKVERKCP